MMFDDHCLIDTADIDELRDLLARKGLHCGSPARSGSPDRLCKINMLPGTGYYLAYLEYGADLTIEMPDGGPTYTLSVPLDGRIEFARGRETTHCAGHQGAITSPNRDTRLGVAQGARRLSVSLDRGLLEGHLERLSHRHVQGVVDFRTDIDLRFGHGQILRSTLLTLAAQPRHDGGPLQGPMQQAHFVNTVIGSVLLGQRHSHSRLIQTCNAQGTSRDVRRVLDYVHANLANPVTLTDLVDVAGVPARTLNQHFRAATGFPPMSYLRRQRMAAVRQVLRSEPGTTVTATATRFGFFHFGRFAAEYRRMFGETPSETRRGAFGVRSG